MGKVNLQLKELIENNTHVRLSVPALSPSIVSTTKQEIRITIAAMVGHEQFHFSPTLLVASILNYDHMSIFCN